MARDAIGLYCRAVGRNLELPRPQRRKLLAGLRQDLEEGHCAQAPDWQDLCDELGSPAETAETLMESVSPSCKAAYRRRKKQRIIAVFALLVLLLVALGMLFSHLATTQVVRAEEHIIVHETVYE